MEKAYLLKVKDGEWNTWKSWCREISTTLRDEAILSIEEEQVLHELTLGFSIENTHYVLGYMEGDILPANMDREINKRHRAMKQQCLERVGEAEVLYNLKAR